jgi:Nif-specific regulatory protein
MPRRTTKKVVNLATDGIEHLVTTNIATSAAFPMANNAANSAASRATNSVANSAASSAAGDRLKRERDRLDILVSIGRLLDRHTDLAEACNAILDMLETRCGLNKGIVAFIDQPRGVLRVVASHDSDDDPGGHGQFRKGSEIRLGQGAAGKAFETGLPGIEARGPLGPVRYWIPVTDSAGAIGILGMERPSLPDDPARMASRKPEPGDNERITTRPPAGPAGPAGPASSASSAGPAGPANPASTLADSIPASMPSAIIQDEDMELLGRIAELLADAAALRKAMSGSIGGSRVAADAPDGSGPGFPVVPITPAGRSPFGNMVGTSDAMQEVYGLIEQVAPTEATVLILGESGTGKELAAADLHRGSKRANGPYMKVNCAALPESVIESELFGHEKGAFTGALGQRKGRFEMANGGTIFLDEIGDLSLQVQVKLLRVLQEREIERVGGGIPIKVDVRIIAATNRNLEAALRAGTFREDLFYRLNVFPLRMPPLRERKSDILLLADWFAEKYAARNGKSIRRISSPAIDLLASYHWPGNVRELENSIERAVILSTDMVIHAWHLPPSLQTASSTHTEPTATLEAALSRLEKELIVEALKIHKGNMAAAARRLGITERQMGLRVHHYAIDWRSYRPAAIRP